MASPDTETFRDLQAAATSHRGDRVFNRVITAAAFTALLVLAGIAVFLGLQTIPAFQSQGLSFITTTAWDINTDPPTAGIWGMLYGSVLLAVIGLVIAVPASILLSIFMVFIGRGAEARNHRQWQHLQRMSGQFLDAVQGLLPIKLLGAGARMTASVGDAADPTLRDDVVKAVIDAEAYRWQTFLTVTRMLEGESTGSESSMTKIYWSELDVRIHETALGLLCPDAELDGPWMKG